MSDQHDFDQLERRSFLKIAGFSFASVLASCSRAPVEKAIPLLNQPAEMPPGRALFYASTCAACEAGCGILIKNRDGRPIKLEGNPDHPISKGGLCAAGQASILGLYDSLRIKTPLIQGNKSTWETVDAEIISELRTIAARSGRVRFLTGTVTSPTLRATIDEFLSTFRDARRISYDPLSRSAILDAHLRTHGVRILPRFRFEMADTIVALDADFLGTWVSPVEHTVGYREGRRLKGQPARMSYHVQFEPRLSLTGANADRRFAVGPEALGLIAAHLAERIISRVHAQIEVPALASPPVPSGYLDRLADRLVQSPGRSLVISGSRDVKVQLLCNLINHLLGNYGKTVDIEQRSYQGEGNERDLSQLIEELRAGDVDALFVLGVNPVYDLAGIPEISSLISRIPLSVTFSNQQDETTELMKYTCPDHHPLESWGDSEAVEGVFSLSQPAIAPLGASRAAIESIAAWSGQAGNAYDLVRKHWHGKIFPRWKGGTSFDEFWDKTLHDGWVELPPSSPRPNPFNAKGVTWVTQVDGPPAGHFRLMPYAKVGMLDGSQANNPWLQELPDPITKVTWDNYACLSAKAGQDLGVTTGDVVRITVSESTASRSLELPAFIQPGQHDGVIAIALGYGRKTTARFAGIGPEWLEAGPSVNSDGLVGQNIWRLTSPLDALMDPNGRIVSIAATGKRRELACTQQHHRLITSSLVSGPVKPPGRQVELSVLNSGSIHEAGHAPAGDSHEDLWPEDHKFGPKRWAMVVDLNACTGCSSCVVACQIENNIPVVGRDEVRRQREMHWLRIDSYYSDDSTDPRPVFQPMMCQQCGHAPCETVCPVLATVHSADGLNQQVYNRCVGTRYCANNCPYKTRRFNWFDYPREDRLANMVLNPDVTVRTRGIMEKCSFCIQRIQEARIRAKSEGRELKDGAVMTACQQSCPASAIHFGDLNDPTSRVSRLVAEDPRRYRVLEELNTRPAVTYLARVRNGIEEGMAREEAGTNHG
ncbi:MAG TPA: 4Fe-4S dicluster domain-containing protein [Acidobacteriota bacterium]|mgnify:CR=1 FL=1|nr:4Fe-4S dicluster domain-containing protein [Acidobacteriota bacterium]